MRKSIFVICLLALCTFSFASTALAIDEMYVSGNVGAVMLDDSSTDFAGIASTEISHDTGYALAVAVGRKFESARVEGELGYRVNDNDKSDSVSIGGDVKALSFMLNAYFDIDTKTAFTPFIGGGIGVANIDAKIESPGARGRDDASVFAYQAIAGVAFQISDKSSLDLSYRYFATREPNFEGNIESEYKGHNLMLGIRYSF